jgi:hypothetical protein
MRAPAHRVGVATGPFTGDAMRIRTRNLLRLALLALLALAQLSCATVPLTPGNESMPAARLALPAEQRVFYDALQGYGDWLLIEPWGYVFRPFDSDEYWRPYLYGYWAPSEMYGWVWISSEPYGWATYHYGQWFYDDYQGWVWIPADDWGPAWVSWVMSDDYVGWAPRFPPGYSPELAPGGGYLYVTIASLAASDLPRRARTPAQIGVALGTPVAVEDLREQGGVVFNAGPPTDVVERRAGPLTRVRLEDLAPGPAGPARRSGEEVAQRARSVVERGAAPPPTVGIVRPDLRRGAAGGFRPDTPAVARPRPVAPRRAAADSTQRR